MKRPVRWFLPALLACSASFVAAKAAALTDLTSGRRLVLRDRENPRSDRAVFRFANDPELIFISVSPLCPVESSVQIVTDTAIHAPQVLDCANWQIRGLSARYKENPAGSGSLRRLVLRSGRLAVTLKGPPYSDDPVHGPVAWVETRVTIGTTQYCGRWEAPPSDPRRNEPGGVIFRGPSAPCIVVCGNGIIEPPEACDDGNAVDGDGCDQNCLPTACGNGIETAGEECDDGNAIDGDGCRADCTVEVCGDGIVDGPSEECDDGNAADGDCCSSACLFEGTGSPCADDGNECTDDECDGAGLCEHPANTASCTDHDGCTANDVCSGGVCVGDLRPPWINELDYDDFFGAIDDQDEFIEIAGPAGTDLSFYRIVNVEGGSAGAPCYTPPFAPFAGVGEANLDVTIPAGTILGDDTGTGIGFYVACFSGSSLNVVNLPACDDVLLAPRLDSNLTNGYLTNVDEVTCPDGVLLLDSTGSYVDGVSYEGIVPQVGTYGPLFHTFAPYSAPRDEGWLAGVSIEKVSSSIERAQSAAEWRDPSETMDCVGQQGTNCVGFSWTPGTENTLQSLECGSPGAAFLDSSGSLLE